GACTPSWRPPATAARRTCRATGPRDPCCVTSLGGDGPPGAGDGCSGCGGAGGRSARVPRRKDPPQIGTGWLCASASTPKVPATPGNQNPSNSGTTPRVCRDEQLGEEVPCSNYIGVWDSARQCYAFEWGA